MAKKTERLEIVLSGEEKDFLKKKSTEAGLNLSTYVREKILSEKSSNSKMNKLEIKSEIDSDQERAKKTNRLEFVLTEKQKKAIQKKAGEMGYSLSQYCRKIIMNHKIVVKSDIEMVRQIRKIGVNINQIAHKINGEPTNKNIQIGLVELKTYMELLQQMGAKYDS